MTSYPIIILLFGILFCTVTTVLAVMLKRSNSNKDKLLAKMQASLSSGREAEQDGAVFKDNLRSAELTTRLQQPRLIVQQQNHFSTAPERYRYIQSMVEMGLSAQKIAATLSMSLHETTQIITLLKMANPHRQDATSPLPLSEANDVRHNQHDWSRWPEATRHESPLNPEDGIFATNYSVPKLENDCHITPMNGISAFRSLFSCKKYKKISCKAPNQPATKEHPSKNYASHQAPDSAQSGVVHRSRKLARWLKIRAFPPCLRRQGSREPPRNPLPRNNNPSSAPLSGYT